MKLGIIGFPQSGKTTLFNLLTGAGVATARAGSRGDLHVGIARVRDERLERLGVLFAPRRVVFASVEIVDLAGFDRGQRARLDIADLRNADALLHVVRAFPSPVLGPAPDPVREVQALEEELILSDLDVAERRLDKLGPGLKRKATEAEQRERALLERVKEWLENGVALRTQTLSRDDARLVRGFQFLSLKPVLHCLNLTEADVAARDRPLAVLGDLAERPGTRVGWVSAAVEAEVAALPLEEQRTFFEALGLPGPALDRVIRDGYALLGLVSFFTIGDDEVRAWTTPAGATALEAAGTVHSDMARGFIRAEVIGWADLLAAGSFAEARHRGWLKLEGREYPVQDGEVCYFRFHVGR